MAVDLDDEADDLIVSRQRSFRRLQFVGIGLLFVVMAMSVALAVYFYLVFGSLKEAADRLEHGAFEGRIASDRQTNQVAGLERATRRAFGEFRDMVKASSGPQVVEVVDPAPAIDVVRAYLGRGVITLRDEQLVETAAESAAATPPVSALLKGALGVLEWNRTGEQILKDSPGLPQALVDAKALFTAASADPALATTAQTGLAWIAYLYASSGRSNYAPNDCADVFSAIAATQPDTGPQAYFWQASCNRKRGKTLEALAGYSHILSGDGVDVATATSLNGRKQDAELLLEMNAFHGVGTQLISTYEVDAAQISEALGLAMKLCSPGSSVLSPAQVTLKLRMELARACLNRAIKLRAQLDQTPNERSGSLENISFAYLREHDFEHALENAQQVERTGLFAWNELVRALAAEHVETADARKAGAQARRNIGFYAVTAFNPCELQVLLDKTLFAEVDAIVKREHKEGGLECQDRTEAGMAPSRPS